MARQAAAPDDFFRRIKHLRRGLATVANRAGQRSVVWLREFAKGTTAFNDRTGKLRKSIRSGFIARAKRERPVAVIALSAGYDNVYYKRFGKIIRTSQYALSIEKGGPNPWTGRNNFPRPFIQPSMEMHNRMGCPGLFLQDELRKWMA